MRKYSVIVGTSLMFLSRAPTASACEFDFHAVEFKGSPVEQARCLMPRFTGAANLRSEIGPRETLGEPLESLVGKPVLLDKHKLAVALENTGLPDPSKAIGLPVSKTAGGVSAKYFLIHDTSTPVAGKDFPSPDSKSMRKLGAKWSDGTWRAHAWVNRIGESRITVDYSQRLPNTAIKFEKTNQNLRGLFLHTEVTQPRVLVAVLKNGKAVRNKNGRIVMTDKVVPVPAFLPEQYKTLALLYIYASAKRGKWLVPAFHIALDYGRSDGHDDPQHFDVDQFSSSLKAWLDDLSPAR